MFRYNMLWQQIPSVAVTDLLCVQSKMTRSVQHTSGIVLDTEHAMFNPETIYNCIRMLRSHNMLAAVRVSNYELAPQCLDAAADVIIFSTVETREDVERIVDLCVTPTVGKRGTGLVVANAWGQLPLVPARPGIVLQIETARGISNLVDIFTVAFNAGLEAFYMIGPYDLARSIGLKKVDYENHDFRRMMCTFCNVVNRSAYRGIHLVYPPPPAVEEEFKFTEWGFVARGIDTLALSKYALEIFNESR